MSEGILDYLSPLKMFRAKEFPSGSVWLNTKEPLSLEKLRGNIIVLDFWTYCCANCMHMNHEIDVIMEKYKNDPVIVIGVHSAKFTNEQDQKNIESAVERYEIEHPVVIDVDMRIWKAYGSQGWPTIVVVDPEGNIVYRQSGEGQIESLSQVIDNTLKKHADDKTLASKKLAIEMPQKERSKTMLSFPGKIALSPNGISIAISDSNNNRILVVDLKSHAIKEIIGGKKGFGDGKFDKATLYRPQGVLWLDDNTIFIADTENHAIRKALIDKKELTTVAGTGSESKWLALGGDALKIALNSPWDLAYSKGNIYIAMAGTHQIWAYGLESGKITPFAGSGFEGIEDGKGMGCLLAQPSGLSADGEYLYFADSESSSARRAEIATKKVETLVGSGMFHFGYKDGALRSAQLQHPLGIAAKGDSVYVADTYNHAVRMIDLKKKEVSTIVGMQNNPGVCRFDDPNCDVLGLYEPNDVKLNGEDLYIADTNNHLIRIFNFKTKLLSTFNIKEG